MPIPFSLVCDLLEECQRLSIAEKPTTYAVVDWFSQHRHRVDAHDTDLTALLSTLLPERRTDRVYCIQAASLDKIIARALILGASRIAELARYKQPGLGLDLADCVERILIATPNPLSLNGADITVEEIDALLHGLASKTKWSSPAVRCPRAGSTQRNRGDLEDVYRRLRAREAKWFTRLVLKDFRPLILDSNLVCHCCHPLLPWVLRIQEDFAAAISVVRGDGGECRPTATRSTSSSRNLLSTLKPKLGIKVGRQTWLKARSIKHCIDLGRGRMSVENKVDGEYCQIHVNASGNQQTIKIFSKSGKDSTEDRRGLREAIMQSLKLGLPGSNIRRECILEGELVVYSDMEGKILPFHKIRTHVARRGLFLGADDDTPPQPWENLMIVFFDMLLLDGRSLLDLRHSERFKMLEETVRPIRGRAQLVSRQVIDFGHRFAVSELRKLFAKVITEKGEGLVLKPDEPYFSIRLGVQSSAGRCIKLKKEYIGAFGDVGDFAVVGAGFCAAKAKSYGIPNLQWTHFYLGCLDNKEQVQRWKVTPEFTVVGVVELNATQLRAMRTCSNLLPVPRSENSDTKFRVPRGIETNPPLSLAFRNPPVFDLRCFSFDKPGNTGFWTLRFPYVSKIHFDRDFLQTVSFEELQSMARDATAAPEMEDSQENLAWIARLEGADPRGLAVDAASQMTMTSIATPSPVKSTQTAAERGWRTSPATMEKACRVWKGPQISEAHGRETGKSTERSALEAPFASCLPQEVTLQTEASNSARKRSAAVHVSPSRKRRRPLGSELTSLTTPAEGPRRPLIPAHGNASQDPAGPRDGAPTELPGPKSPPKDGDQPSVPDPVGCISASHSRRKKTLSSDGESGRSQSGDASARVTTGPSRDTSCLPVPADGDVPRSTSAKSGSQCIYAGSKCNLAAATIILSSAALMHSSEASALLKAHAVLGTVLVADQWLKSHPRTGRTRILLVDSIERGDETKALLARIEEAGKNVPRRRRGWTTVYDWRVLRHVSILEDQSVDNKYYDGFHSPWRRWYCGIV